MTSLKDLVEFKGYYENLKNLQKENMTQVVPMIAVKFRKNSVVKVKYYNTKQEALQAKAKLRMHKNKFLGSYPVEAIIKD